MKKSNLLKKVVPVVALALFSAGILFTGMDVSAEGRLVSDDMPAAPTVSEAVLS